jgi:S-adenosylmethionine:tRNA ribosyltransferase-isomerase
MKTSDFDYDLPPERIAQEPASPRESARLMVVDRTKDSFSHRTIRDLPEYFSPGDLVVVNVSKVFNARLVGSLPDGKSCEVFLIKPDGGRWRALGKPGKKLDSGARIFFALDFSCTVIQKHPDGSLTVDFGLTKDEVMKRANRYGQVPVPPYIKKVPADDAYQTVYAKHEGSVAAPTAGFHLTASLIEIFKARGVEFREVTLHVGLGTFQPIRADDLKGHEMHSEWVEIPEETVKAIMKAKIERRRVIAVGTTTVRALEGSVQKCGGRLCAWHGEVDIFISPGFEFKIVDALLTNFHLPKSTLLVLVSALADPETIKAAYREAVELKYRFYSFGDAMLII